MTHAKSTNSPAKQALGIVLARAGSKGLPGKNETILAGKPLVVWTIEHALASRLLRRVVLSTDGEKLANIGRASGVTVLMRPPELASDIATVDSAARHAVLAIEQQERCTYDHLVILYGNVPLRPADLTDRALTKLRDSGCDSVQSVYPVGKMHPFWMKTLGGPQGDSLLMYQDNQIYRRQELPPVYMLDGGIIAVTRASLFKVQPGQPHAFLGQDRRAIVTQPGQVVDIDSDLDLRLTRAMLEAPCD